MGYDLVIGEQVEEHEPGEPVRITAKVINREDAPYWAGDALTGHTNHRQPSYVGWEAFARATGLEHFFFGIDRGLLRKHPGVVPLTAAHLETVRLALSAWRARHPGAKPGWCACPACTPEGYRPLDVPHEDLDGQLGRLVWLEWWMDWALRNCERPVFANW